MKNIRSAFALLALAALFGAQNLSAQETAFTYQGRLNDNGAVANGVYDLQLTVFNALSNGSPAGVTNTLEDVAVTNGLFTVALDPGAGVFDGSARWLEVRVRPGASTGAFTPLAPRQKITPAPMAIYAGRAGSLAGALPDAQLSTNVALLNQPDQTFSGVVNFPNASNQFNGAFTGNFAGNGGGLSNVSGSAIVNTSLLATAIAGGQVVKNLNGLKDAVSLAAGNNIFLSTNTTNNTLTVLTAPGLLSWIPVAGTTQAAAVNKGYLLTNHSLVTVTLPAAPALADIVRVSGSGTGGWKVAQNAGQNIRIKNLTGNIGVNWTPRDSGRAWNSIASSDDGRKLAATTAGSQIYVSSNYGTNWTAVENGRNWSAIASSADGNKLVATVNGGQIYTSTNSGATWTPRDTGRAWISVASSASGDILIAGVSGNLNYLSTDSGFTWTPYPIAAGGKLACSADGLKMVVAVNNGQIYTSTDSGGTWIPRVAAAAWSAVASSADGVKLVATINPGQIYTSTDSGGTWTNRDSSRAWNGVASSADGTRLAATVSGGQIYTSIDSGLTWAARESNRSWTAIAVSADGTRLAATVNGGQIYVSDNLNPVTTTGVTGYLLGEPNAAVELQYIGNNQFLPISHEGLIIGF